MALVVLLRGVNVGGHRTFRPAALARELAHLDAVNIGTAGTFVVRKPIGITALRAEIARRLPFETEIMICRGYDVARLVALDPFAAHSARRDIVPFVSLLSRVSRSAPRIPLRLPERGESLLTILGRDGRFVYGFYRRDMKTLKWLGALDRVLGVPVTTRNWNTISTIARAVAG